MANSFDVGAVTATVKADISDFKKNMTQAQDQVKGFGTNLSKIGEGIKDFSNKATIFTGVMVAGLTVFAKTSYDAYKGAEVAQKSLEHAVLQVTKATKEQLQATMDLADELERKGVLDGDNIKMGMAQLSTFGLSNKAVQGLSGSLADLAVNQFGVSASGDQLSQTANMIAKALNGQFGVLEKSGIRFTDLQKSIIATGTEMEKVKAINEGFAQNLKFTNAVAKETSEGAMARLQVRFENLQENIGQLIAVAILPLVSALADLFDNKAIGEFFADFQTTQLAQGILAIKDALTQFSAWVAENQTLVIGFLQAMAMTIGTLMIIGTVNALLTALLNPFTLVVIALQLLYFAFTTNFMGIQTITQNVITALMGFFNDVLMPAISLLVQFFTDNWGQIQLVTQVLWDIVTSLFTIATFVITELIKVFLLNIQNFWKAHGESVMKGLQGFWDIVVGLFKTVTGIISVILAVFFGLITGKWDEAWQKILKGTILAIQGIEKTLSGIISFITGWGGTILGILVKPFQDAWNKISELVNKIKDALDFTKRHSPSILDIVKSGVGKVNNALSDLQFNTMLSPNMIAQTVSNGGKSMSIANINIDLNGAIIGGEADAMSLAERIGDGIIAKLQHSVRI